MSASAAFGEALDALGIWWPRGDGDALRDTARSWVAMADFIDDIASVLDAAATNVADTHHGRAASSFAAMWATWRSDHGHLGVVAADCRRLAAALGDFATDIDVADRRIVQLLEQALAASVVAPPVSGWRPGPPFAIDATCRQWLHDGAEVVRAEFEHRTARCRQHVGEVRERVVRPPGSRGAIGPGANSVLDPDAISWPDPGRPRDLGFLLSGIVDLGAGQGNLLRPPPIGVTPIDVTPIEPLPPDVGVRPPAAPSGGGITINITGNDNTVTIGAASSPDRFTIPDVVAPPPLAALDAIEPLADVELLDADSTDIGGGGGGLGAGGLGGGGFGAGGGFGGGLPASGFDAGALDLGAVPDQVPPTIPIDVTPAVPVAAAAGGAAAAAAASKNRPFLPFMPMGGGGMTGDEGAEPKRRRTTRR